MRNFGRSASYWTAAGVVAQTLWTSGAPVMTYPLYASEWHLSPVTTAAIFAVFPIVVVTVRVSVGNVSDFIGRRATILAGLGASLFGVVLFAVAPDVTYLFIGRAWMGVGVGLTAGAASAALVEFSSAAGSKNVGAVTTAAQSLGFVLATLVGGAFVEFAPLPTRLSFWMLAAFIVALLAASWFLPSTYSERRAGPWTPRGLEIPRDMLGPFCAAALAGVVSYTIGALLLSIGAQVTRDLIGSDNAFINGAALAHFR
jgi:MFS family permease